MPLDEDPGNSAELLDRKRDAAEIAPDEPSSEELGSWRDLIPVHKAADLFPMMPDDELAELGRDIMEHDLRFPLSLWTPVMPDAEASGCTGAQLPEPVYLLDGRNRLAAIERGIADPDQCKAALAAALSREAVTLLWGDTDPEDYVVSVNVRRRHLTREQKRHLVATLLKDRPNRSDRATAKLATVSGKTVAGVRADLQRRAEIPHVAARADSKGRQQPAHKAVKPSLHDRRHASTRQTPPARARDQAISLLSNRLRHHPAETLRDIARILEDGHLGEIKLSEEQRLDFYRRYLGFAESLRDADGRRSMSQEALP